MIRRLFFLSIMVILHSSSISACDVCGCGASSGYMGLVSSFKNNQVRIGVSSASFKGNQGSATVDHFHSVRLDVRYHFTDRFKVIVSQPYLINNRNDENGNTTVKGISDTQILGGYSIFKDKKIGKSFTMFWEVNAGVKLPIGKYDPDIHDKNLPENFNVSNGSWAGLLQSNMVFSHKEIGFLLGGNYQHNGKTRSDYRFGHQISTQYMFFWNKAISENFKITPNVGLIQEWITEDHYANKNIVNGTGGNGTYFNSGINLQWKEWILGGNYSQPIINDYSQGNVSARGRFSVQFAFIF